MVTREQVAASKAIHRTTGRTFYVATRLLPRRVRRATYVLYAFFRIADEVVDDAGDASADRQRATLERLRAEGLGERPTTDPVLAAFRELRERNGIADADVEEFVAAMEVDVEKRRYDTYRELEAYMGGSAVAVANMMTAIMRPADPELARPHAAALGEAFQLTNFLRDVREDVVERDRIYLPRTTRDAFGVDDDQVVALRMSEGFAGVMRTELDRTEALYRHGVAGIRLLPRDCQFPVLLAAVLYAEYHRLIRRQGYDVLSTPPTLSRSRTLLLYVRTRWQWFRHRDPETVFYAVSPVEPGSFDDRARETTLLAPVRRSVSRLLR